MADKNDNTCAHEMCSCAVGDDADYCSPQCEADEGQSMTTIKCDCGHTGCEGEV